ncbi:hypothetical protein [Nodularia sp. LEGE 04288]|uniref:hypothetical protein n=1 Tax=Nodularia sp. LEGE 04288 TaxID=1828639 RepID=UPI001D11B03B|nr:hypothetical protein [Nodularia sp. LEGE 04288]MCC2695224.1 hypothetical protein [Nodularia sp. LEGE 04288]
MNNQPFSQDRTDKDNPHYTFTPPSNYTPQEVEAGNKLVEILNDPSLSETDKKKACWEILNNV